MATQKIPHWAVLLGNNEMLVVQFTAEHVAVTQGDQYAEFMASWKTTSANVIKFSRAGLIEAEEAIDLWALNCSPSDLLAREAGRLCCRLQAIVRLEPNGYDEIELPPAKPVEMQISLFGGSEE